MCKPVCESRTGLGVGVVALAAGGVGLGVWLAPAALAGALLVLWLVKVIVVATAAAGLGYVVWEFADCVPVPSVRIRRPARRPLALPATQSRLAITAAAPVRALTPTELGALRAAQAVR